MPNQSSSPISETRSQRKPCSNKHSTAETAKGRKILTTPYLLPNHCRCQFNGINLIVYRLQSNRSLVYKYRPPVSSAISRSVVSSRPARRRVKCGPQWCSNANRIDAKIQCRAAFAATSADLFPHCSPIGKQDHHSGLGITLLQALSSNQFHHPQPFLVHLPCRPGSAE